MPFIIKVWIPIDAEDPQKYTSKQEAEDDIASMEIMQPENRYEVLEV